ncbi:MAG: RNA 2',3'-cyclic phosphodiesterase [Pseudomonadota bacterium]
MPSSESRSSDAGEAAAREPTRRLYFALWPSEEERKALVHATRKIVRAAGGRRMPPGNLHITLAFLGSVPERRIPELEAAAGRAAQAFRAAGGVPVNVTLDRIEHWAKPQIVGATTSLPPRAAADLASILRRELVAAGFAPDLKPFRAHVTLVRKVARRTMSDVEMPPVTWSFTGFALVESRTTPSGSLYSIVRSWPLDGG